MKTKRLFALLLVLMLVMTQFSGCCLLFNRVKNQEAISGRDETLKSSEDATENTFEAIVTTEPTEVATTVPEVTEPEILEPDVALTLGYWEGNTYINEYAGYKATFDSPWVCYTASDLQTLPEDLSDPFSGGTTQIMDMQVQNGNTLESVNVIYQDPATFGNNFVKGLSEEQIVNMMLLVKDSLITTYEAAGITVSSIDKTTVTFLGETHYALRTECTVSGISYYVVQLIDFGAGEIPVFLTVGTFVTDTTQDVLNMFTAP